MKPPSTRIQPRAFDPRLATEYLRTRLSVLPPEKVDELCTVLDRHRTTIEAWCEGRTLPIRSVWPKISLFLGEPHGAMFDAAAIEKVDVARGPLGHPRPEAMGAKT